MPRRLSDSDESDAPVPKRVKKAAPKKKKQALARSGSESEAVASDNASNDKGKGKEKENSKSKLSNQEEKALIQELIRYCLFSEMTKRPITRAEIAKTVLAGGKSRHFTTLLDEVQSSLRDVFGMELIPLPMKVVDKKASKSWVLRTTIPQHLIAKSNGLVIKHLAVDPKGNRVMELKGLEAEVANWEVDQGFSRNWKKEDGPAYGILGIILGLILVNGKSLTDQQLKSFLSKLSLNISKEQDSTLPGSITSAPIKMSTFLTNLIKQKYLEKTAASGTGKVKKGDEDITVWIWGARAFVEFGETGIADFLRTINESSGVQTRGTEARLTQEAYYKDLKRATGGDLTNAVDIRASKF